MTGVRQHAAGGRQGVAYIKRGKLVEGKDYKLNDESTIKHAPIGGTYKYIGIAQVFQPIRKAI